MRFTRFIPTISVVFAALCVTGCQRSPDSLTVIRDLPPAYALHREPAPLPQILAAHSEKPDASPRWDPPVELSTKWRYIVVHHSATPYGSVRMFDKMHRNNGWENGCGYHFVIGNGSDTPDGLIEPGPRWQKQQVGAHTRLSPKHARKLRTKENYYNDHGIGIVLVGNFSERRPSKKQMDSLMSLLKYACEACNIKPDHVIGHGEVDQTDCPGERFDMDRLREALAESAEDEPTDSSILATSHSR